MKNNGKGGMQTAGANCSIICPKCGKPAARFDRFGFMGAESYMHFTKNGAVWHVFENRKWKICRKEPKWIKPLGEVTQP